jgi:hypothetical protein
MIGIARGIFPGNIRGNSEVERRRGTGFLQILLARDKHKLNILD